MTTANIVFGTVVDLTNVGYLDVDIIEKYGYVEACSRWLSSSELPYLVSGNGGDGEEVAVIYLTGADSAWPYYEYIKLEADRTEVMGFIAWCKRMNFDEPSWVLFSYYDSW